jgi:hypothetical protein
MQSPLLASDSFLAILHKFTAILSNPLIAVEFVFQSTAYRSPNIQTAFSRVDADGSWTPLSVEGNNTTGLE